MIKAAEDTEHKNVATTGNKPALALFCGYSPAAILLKE